MGKKTRTSIGLDYDSCGIRIARISFPGRGKESGHSVESLEEISGEFDSNETLIKGLKDMAARINIRPHEKIVACAYGRQVYMTQVKNRNLPRAEMKNALRADLRKTLKVEITGSVMDYHAMEVEDNPDEKKSHVAVTAVIHNVFKNQMQVLEAAGFSPSIVDVLPAASANSFWMSRPDKWETAPLSAFAIFHISPDTCTVVIDGRSVPFYTRCISFSAGDVFKASGENMTDREKQVHLEEFAGEIKRSLSYYINTFGAFEFAGFALQGPYAGNAELKKNTGESLSIGMDEFSLLKKLGVTDDNASRFDIAAVLGLRGCNAE